MIKKIKANILVIGIIIAFFLGITVPMSKAAEDGILLAGNIGVAAVFLAYGLRIRTREVLSGLRDVKLQGALLLLTFVIFPLIGITFYYICGIFSTSPFLLGILYLTLLPSTIQSSVTFVSLAGGDVARAVCAATISNILGIFITPVLVLIFLDLEGASAGNFGKVVCQLLLPFLIGQLFQPFTGKYLRKHKWITQTIDTSAIILVVFGAVLKATSAGVWAGVTSFEIVLVLLLSSLILALAIVLSIGISRIFRQPKSSEIVFIMCGSMKSLATGLPMANALFPVASVAPIIVPVIIYHQIQLFTCSVIANQLAKK